MHPREGWQPDGTRRRPELSRRQALQRGFAAAVLAGGGATLLDACAAYLVGPNNIPLPRPTNPVTWPVSGNSAIPNGMAPEKGATLQVYNWVAYINQACVNSFAKKYNCKVEVTTFNTMNEALSKLRSGLKFDVLMGATVDVLGDLIESKLIQPLNHSYIPNIHQAWPDFSNPYYDRGWQYTVPYTIYTTGIAWRKDKVRENPYAMAQPVEGDVLPAPVQGQDRDPGRLPGGHQPRADDERHLRPQHHQQGPDRSVQADAAATGRRRRYADRQQRLQRGPGRADLDPSRLVWRHGRGRRATCPRAYRWRSSATGSPRTARARSPTTPTRCCARPRIRCWPTLS